MNGQQTVTEYTKYACVLAVSSSCNRLHKNSNNRL